MQHLIIDGFNEMGKEALMYGFCKDFSPWNVSLFNCFGDKRKLNKILDNIWHNKEGILNEKTAAIIINEIPHNLADISIFYPYTNPFGIRDGRGTEINPLIILVFQGESKYIYKGKFIKSPSCTRRFVHFNISYLNQDHKKAICNYDRTT